MHVPCENLKTLNPATSISWLPTRDGYVKESMQPQLQREANIVQLIPGKGVDKGLINFEDSKIQLFQDQVRPSYLSCEIAILGVK